jgi:L-galactose dehydrogenase
MQANLGVMAMYAVRGALARKDRLDNLVAKLISIGEIDPQAVGTNDLCDLLLEPGISGSLTELPTAFVATVQVSTSS